MQKDSSNHWGIYTTSLYPLIGKYIDDHRDGDTTRFLSIAYGFYSFHTEKLATKCTKNQAYLNDCSVFVLYMHDNLRALSTLQAHLHVAPLAFVLRSILEAWCTAKYIFASPEDRFQKYKLYAQVEKYAAYKEGRHPIGDEELSAIKVAIAPWLYFKGKEERVIFHWTANRDTNFKTMAKEVGLINEYNFWQASASMFTHCSSTIVNTYSGHAGISPMPLNDNGPMIALRAAGFALNFLKDMYSFLGIEFPEREHQKLQILWLLTGNKYTKALTKDEEEEFLAELHRLTGQPK